MGLYAHYKLPHYVTFQSSLDRVRKAQTITQGLQDIKTKEETI